MALQTKADVVGKYVNTKVMRLQHGYVGDDPRQKTWARARLARLRRLDRVAGGDWMSVGDELFEDWPEELGVPEPQSRKLRAVKAALQLYAYHQQSKSSMGMNLAIDGDTPQKRAAQRRIGSFGSACRAIQPDLDKANGVRNRLHALETAGDYDDTVRIMRELVRLMRGIDHPERCRISYRELAKDLYLLQFDAKRDDIIMQWGRDYYTNRSSSKEDSSDNR